MIGEFLYGNTTEDVSLTVYVFVVYGVIGPGTGVSGFFVRIDWIGFESSRLCHT